MPVVKMLNELAKATGGTIEEVGGPLPDGSGFATMSMPLPKDHWLYDPKDTPPPMPMRVGTEHPRYRELHQMVREAARYAIRAATNNGKIVDFDPDAMVQCLQVGLLGYHTPNGLGREAWEDPDPIPPPVWPRWCTMEVDEHGDLTLSRVYNSIGITTDQGRIGVAQRDGGIEVVLDTPQGRLSWSSVEAWGSKPQTNAGRLS